jgi:hypothetical protein
VRIALAYDDQRVRLEVIDNGIGLTRDQFNKPKTHGLFGMRQRVSAKGGRIDIHSLPQRLGTEIQVVLPLCNPADAPNIATEVTESTAPQASASATPGHDAGESPASPASPEPPDTPQTPRHPRPPVGMH